MLRKNQNQLSQLHNRIAECASGLNNKCNSNDIVTSAILKKNQIINICLLNALIRTKKYFSTISNLLWT